MKAIQEQDGVMTTTRNPVRAWVRKPAAWLAAVLLPLAGAMVLSSCGGGAMALAALGGVGTGGTGMTIGTVIAFGSVGFESTTSPNNYHVEYDSQTPQYYEDGGSAQTAATTVGLGDRMQVQTDASNNPLTMTVEPTLIGTIQGVPVTNLASGTGSFVVNGVTVQTNVDPTKGPVTFYAGMTDVTSLASGMSVEVHGLFHADSSGTGSGNYIQATRIALIPASVTAGTARITGVVAGLNANTGTFLIAYSGMTVQFTSGTTMQPSGIALANGQVVNVLGTVSGTTTSTIAATSIRVHSLQGESGAVQIEGLVSNSTGSAFTVDGIKVDASAAGLPSVQDGDAVVATGQPNAGGTLVASAIRTYQAQAAQVILKGTITGFVDSSHFLVREVPVTVATGVSVQTVPGGTQEALADGVYVEVTGNPGGLGQGNVVVASAVASSATPPPGAVVDYIGTVASNPSNGTFTLTGTYGGVNNPPVTLASNVQYVNGTSSNLTQGAAVEVEATSTSSGQLTAYSVIFLGATPSSSETQGIVTNWTQTGFSVNGISFTWSAGTTPFCQDCGGHPTAVNPAPSWFVNGANVGVNYTSNGSQNVANLITLEN